MSEIILSELYAPSFELGFIDVLVLSRNISHGPNYDLSIEDLDTNYIFSVNEYNINYSQESNFDTRLAGEGPIASDFKLDKQNYELSFSMPLKIESWGQIDMNFHALFDYYLQGFRGTTTSFLGRVLNASLPISTTAIVVDNILEFSCFNPPFAAQIQSDNFVEQTEDVIVTSIDKRLRTVYVGAGTTQNHTPNLSYVFVDPFDPNEREAEFSLFSLRSGLISGCVVDSIKLDISPDKNLVLKVKIKFKDLDRKYQIDMSQEFDVLSNLLNKRRPSSLISGYQTRINRVTADDNFYVDLGLQKDAKLFHGFIGKDLDNIYIKNLTIDFENNLKPSYTLNSKTLDKNTDRQKNLSPFGYSSEGRTISGKITYTGPITPWLFAEFLAGVSSMNNGGLEINLGPAKIILKDITFSPQGADGALSAERTKELNWTAISSNFDFDPYFESTGNY
jgi:hypothetical protein